MSYSEAIKTLSDTVNSVLVEIPDIGTQRLLVVGIDNGPSGAFVGTLKIQKSTDKGKTYSDCTVTNVVSGTQANPTATGTYAADLGASCTHARVLFSAYTSGDARVDANLRKKL